VCTVLVFGTGCDRIKGMIGGGAAASASASAASNAPTVAAPVALTLPQTGIPPCDAYLSVYACTLQKSGMDPAAVQAAVTQVSSAYIQGETSEAAKSALGTSCVSTLSSLSAQAQAAGCTVPSLAASPLPAANAPVVAAQPQQVPAAAQEGAGGDLPAVTYATYANQGYGFSIDYPSFFTMTTSTSAGEWHWGDNGKILAACAPNDQGRSLADTCKINAGRAGVTWHTAKDNWCISTGASGSRIFYDKVYLIGGNYCSIDFDYPESLKTYFDPIVSHVTASFKMQ
jgi:hypothetical protein